VRKLIPWQRIVTRLSLVSYTVIRIGCCFWRPLSAPPIAAIAPSRGWWESPAHWEQAFAYIEAHTEIRDVLISGGDPMTLADDKLDALLARLRGIRHLEILRIGTKVPVVLPMRITRELIRMLRKFHPLWISIHFTHPRELTPEVATACTRLADAGIPLGNQTVLLRGINDDAETMRVLMQGLLRIRVRGPGAGAARRLGLALYLLRSGYHGRYSGQIHG
jgi:hypothetical protein